MRRSEPFVVVLDDDRRVCDVIERVLIGAGYRVRTFTAPRSYLAEQDTLQPDCVVVDIKMPDVDGLTVLLESRAAGIDTPAVFITGSTDVDSAVQAMKAGASDLLQKPLDTDKLLTAIDTALLRGEQQRAERERILELWQAVDTLTPREAQISALVATGRLNKQIAALIGTTEKTVKVHRARAMTKLHAHSVADLVRAVDRLLDPTGPMSIVFGDHQLLQRPRAVELMMSARETHDIRPSG